MWLTYCCMELTVGFFIFLFFLSRGSLLCTNSWDATELMGLASSGTELWGMWRSAMLSFPFLLRCFWKCLVLLFCFSSVLRFCTQISSRYHARRQICTKTVKLGRSSATWNTKWQQTQSAVTELSCDSRQGRKQKVCSHGRMWGSSILYSTVNKTMKIYFLFAQKWA